MQPEIPVVGTLLSNRYRLLKAVARGGSGHVFRAESTATGELLAVKWIPDPDPSSLAKEIHHTITLRHRNIVPLLDVGEHAGVPFLVCPWLDGGTLRDHIPSDWPETLSILEDVLAGLSFAHSWGVLHCDVKPENILFGGGRWQVTDFGISHTMNVAVPPGTARGTPIYVAPEIISGDLSNQRPWTDLYSVAIMAWEMTTGASPFFGLIRDVLDAHLSRPPGVFEPRMPVPPGLEAWLRTLLAKDPSRRCELAADAIAALRALPSAQAFPLARRHPPTRSENLTFDLESDEPVSGPVPNADGDPLPPGRLPPEDGSEFPDPHVDTNPRFAVKLLQGVPPPPSHRLDHLLERVRERSVCEAWGFQSNAEVRRALGWAQTAWFRTGQCLGLHIDPTGSLRSWLRLAAGQTTEQIEVWCAGQTELAEAIHAALDAPGPLDLDLMTQLMAAVARKRTVLLRLDQVDRHAERRAFARRLAGVGAPILVFALADDPSRTSLREMRFPPPTEEERIAQVRKVILADRPRIEQALKGRTVRDAVLRLSEDLGWQTGSAPYRASRTTSAP